MRHRKAGRGLGRNSAHRWALFRTLVTEFLRHERIETTLAKGKEARQFAEWTISLARQGGLAARRQALAFVRDPEVVARLFNEVGPRYRERPGGYTRLTRTRVRLGDNAQMAVLELVARPPEQPKQKDAQKHAKDKPAGAKPAPRVPA